MNMKIYRQNITYLFIAISIAVISINAGAEVPYKSALPDDIAKKYEKYLEDYKARHIYKGGTVEALLDGQTHSIVEKPWGVGDSQGWTGLTMGAFALQEDWELVKTNLSYWDHLMVEPGRYKRYPEIPEDYGHGQTSIDQYGEMIIGIAITYMVGTPELQEKMKSIITDMISYGKSHDWIMGPGPFSDCTDIKFLFQLFSERMGLGIDVYDEGETYDSLRKRFLETFKAAVLVRSASKNYFTLNLYFERMFVAKLLNPELEGLNEAIKGWYKAVRKDGNTMFDWFYAVSAGKDATFVIDELRKFPDYLPNQWENDGYNLGYRWERSPDERAVSATGEPIEYAGMDFIALASFYSYFKVNGFQSLKAHE